MTAPRRAYGAPGQRAVQRQATVGGPPWQLPVALIGAGLVAYLAGSLMLIAAGGDLSRGLTYGPHQLAAVHLLGLAFVSVVAVGALLQLVPVLLRTTVASPVAGGIAGGTLAVGAWVMAVGLWAETPRVIAFGGGLLALAVALFAVEAARALVRVFRSETGLGVSGVGIGAALAWLVVATAFGATLAGNRADAFAGSHVVDLIEAHAVVTILGWLGGLILAVGMRLGPMFALSHGYARRPGEWGMAAWHVGVALLALGLATNTDAISWIGGVALTAGAAASLWYYRDLARHRRRAIEAPILHLGIGAASVIAAIAIVVIGVAGGIEASRAHAAAAVLCLVGLAVGITAGHVFKIVPMLVWTGRYASMLGTPGTPKLSDLYPVRLARLELVAFGVGLVALVAGILAGSALATRAGAVLLAISAVACLIAAAYCVFGTATAKSPPTPRGATAAPSPASPNQK